MQSEQERILQEFMQRSFGSQFLFLPQKYRKGTAHREPADLAWIAPGLVALFYLSRSNAVLEKQVSHNSSQAAGYLRLWARNQPIYALRGKNRFGEECYIPFRDAKRIIVFLVVSNECNVHWTRNAAENIPTIVIPEKLLEWISEFGGTIVDLLKIVMAEVPLKDALEGSSGLQRLHKGLKAYIRQAMVRADPDQRYLTGTPQQDFVFMLQHLVRSRFMNPQLDQPLNRDALTEFFGDLTFGELSLVAATAEKAIQLSEPPDFKKWVVMKIMGDFYSFVIQTVNLGAKNSQDGIDAALAAAKSDNGFNSILFLYGNVGGLNEYRSPIAFAIPANFGNAHAKVLADQIISLALLRGPHSD